MNERKNEISTALSLIQSICVSSNITLIAKNSKGTLYVAIRDATDGKEYVMTKKGAAE